MVRLILLFFLNRLIQWNMSISPCRMLHAGECSYLQRIRRQQSLILKSKTWQAFRLFFTDAHISKLNIAATYNVINGSPARFVKSGLGYFLTTEDLLSSAFDEELCFRPLEPPLEIHYALIWKRYASFSKAAEKFLEQFYWTPLQVHSCIFM